MADNRAHLRIAVRGYEMDSRGEVTAESMARYLEHARWLTFDPERGLGMHTFFRQGVVRAQRMDLLARVTFPDELDITTWIGRIGRTSFDFVHRAVRVGDGATVALNATTVVNLRDGRPAPVPEQARALVVDDHGPASPALDEPAPRDAWTCELTPRPSDQDVLQHVNQARYLAFAEDARREAAAAGAFGEAGRPDAAPSAASVEYVREARAGQRLTARVWTLAADAGAFGVELADAADAGPLARARLALRP